MSLPDALAAVLSAAFDGPTSVHDLVRLPVLSLREVYRFEADTQGRRRSLILRRDRPPGLPRETDGGEELRAHECLHRLGMPVTEPVFLPPGAEAATFFVSTRTPGARATAPAEDAAGDVIGREALARQAFMLLGALTRADPAALASPSGAPLAGGGDPHEPWRRELTRWERALDRSEDQPSAAARAAIRGLRRAPPPPPPRLAIVHGDFRGGNLLHDGRGRLLEIADWGLAHVGDPLEDLAWALAPPWGDDGVGLACGLVPREAAIGYWLQGSGLPLDRDALAWWEVFTAVKGLALAALAARCFRTDGGGDAILALGSLCGSRRTEAKLAGMLAGLVDRQP